MSHKAAKIDKSGDINLWFKIGDNAFNLKKYLLSKYSFEYVLKLDAKHWPSIDKLVLLLYSMSNYISKWDLSSLF